jgi:hypothetical protein
MTIELLVGPRNLRCPHLYVIGSSTHDGPTRADGTPYEFCDQCAAEWEHPTKETT